jgi:hypothetical protein
VPALAQLPAGEPAEEAARSGDQHPHGERAYRWSGPALGSERPLT